jgi:hypothetical protein
MVQFSKKELMHIGIATVLLGLLFGYDDGTSTFVASKWTINLITMMFLSLISLIIYISVQKAKAKKLGCEARKFIWGAKNKMPLGVILPLIFIFLSKGFLKIPAILSTDITSKPSKRLSREYAQASDVEEAKIALSGPLVALIIGLLAKTVPGSLASTFTAINFNLAFWNMLPLPTLDGSKVYFGSRLMFFFYFILIAAVFILVHAFIPISSLTAVALAIILGLVGMITYYKKRVIG